MNNSGLSRKSKRKSAPEVDPGLVDLLHIDAEAELARRHFRDYVGLTFPVYDFNWHHDHLCEALQDVVDGKTKYLMVFMPPQHGKSELISRRLPAYALGCFPDWRLAICSYAHDLAQKFSREVQRIMASPEHLRAFGERRIVEGGKRASSENWMRTQHEFEIAGHRGGMIATGIGGPLTGNKVDLLIIDDPVKNMIEAKSRTTQMRNIDWFESVAMTRLHNDSRVIFDMTRWDENDLAGYVLRTSELPWRVIRFPAEKEDDSDPDDPREIGEALWPRRHSTEKLVAHKKRPSIWQALFQQDPKPPTEMMVYPGWKKIDKFPDHLGGIYWLDFGFNAPTAFGRIGFEKKNAYVQELIYDTGLGLENLHKKILSVIHDPRALIVADSEDPLMISDLRKTRRTMEGETLRGLKVIPCVKGPGSVDMGILKVKEYTVFVVNPGRNIWDENRMYQWMPDVNGGPTNEPIDDYNHHMDGIRYAIMAHRPRQTTSEALKDQSFY